MYYISSIFTAIVENVSGKVRFYLIIKIFLAEIEREKKEIFYTFCTSYFIKRNVIFRWFKKKSKFNWYYEYWLAINL